MQMTTNIAKARAWLATSALPLWADVGRDREGGGFVERLTLAGEPDPAVDKRVRVQARQVYVYSHARLLGLMQDGEQIAAEGYDFIMRHACPDGIERGFVHLLARDGTVRDARRDTYDHAFLLFAFSWFYRATGREDVRAAVCTLGDFIWTALRHPGGEGFVIDDRSLAEGGSDALHQNPHMHLFEAVLAAHEATGEQRFLDRAHELFGLFRNRMFDHDHGVLREFRDRDWRPVAGEAGRIIEPGHQCEWVWLLKRYADRIGEPIAPEAYRLHDFALRHGRTAGGVLLCDELWIDGTVKKASARCWPQTEALKAEIALAEARGQPLLPRADAIVDALFAYYLGRPLAGAWIDHVDADGRPMVEAIPASTLYHVFLAFSEYLSCEQA